MRLAAGAGEFDASFLSIPLALAAVVTWLLWVAWVRWRQRPEALPDAEPATMDLRDDPVAVVDLLLSGDVSARAVPATFLDLAARRFFEIFGFGDGRFVCILHSRDASHLELCERMVLDAVHGASSDGQAPLPAAASAMGHDSVEFWSRFKTAVELAAQRRGLLRTRSLSGQEYAAGLVPHGLLVGATVALEPGSFVPAVIAAPVLWLVNVVVLAARSRGLEMTDAGRSAAAHWLGVRRFLEESGTMGSVPAYGVAVWDRYLSVAAAMGLGHDAVKDLLIDFRVTPSRRDLSRTWRLLRDRKAMTQYGAALQAERRSALGADFTEATPFGGSGGSFCELVRKLDLGMKIGPSSPADFQRWMQAAAARFDELGAAAPPELRPDLRTIAATMKTLTAGAKVDRETADVAARVAAGIEAHCGLHCEWLRLDAKEAEP